MTSHFDPSLTESNDTFIDFLCKKDYLTTGELRTYIDAKCPFLVRMFNDNDTWAFGTWANQYFKKIPDCTVRQAVPYRQNKVWFYNREVIDSIERSFAMAALRCLKTGQKEVIPDHIDTRYYFSEWAQKIKAEWAVEITLENMGYTAA